MVKIVESYGMTLIQDNDDVYKSTHCFYLRGTVLILDSDSY